MRWIAIADESGTQGGNKAYGIGAFVIPAPAVKSVEHDLRVKAARRQLTHELKWSDSPSRPYIEFACEEIEYLLRAGMRYYAIIVEKILFRKWHTREEEAFYQTYQYLASHVARSIDDDFELWIDERSDRYDKRAEVVQIITNYKTAQKNGAANLVAVRMIDSNDSRILQLSDVMTGAITADTHRYLGGDAIPMNKAKAEIIRRIAALFEWDRLCYDTYPNPLINIWHFPREFRARPRTRHIGPPDERLTA